MKIESSVRLVLVSNLVTVFFMSSSATAHSLLSKNQLTKATVFNPSAPFHKSKIGDQFWICIKKDLKQKIRTHCDDLGFNNLEGKKEELQIAIQDSFKLYSLGLRHGIPKKECRRIQKKILTLIKNSNEACFRGGFLEPDWNLVSLYMSGVFDELQTNKGGTCEFNFCD